MVSVVMGASDVETAAALRPANAHDIERNPTSDTSHPPVISTQLLYATNQKAKCAVRPLLRVGHSRFTLLHLPRHN